MSRPVLSIDYQKALGQAQSLEKESYTTSYIDLSRSIENNLSVSWSGKAANSFIAEIEDMTEKLRTIPEKIRAIATRIKNTANSIYNQYQRDLRNWEEQEARRREAERQARLAKEQQKSVS